MFNRYFLFFVLFTNIVYSQLIFDKQVTNLGAIIEAYEIKGDVIVKNIGAKKVFLMRADADKDVKIYTSKKTLLPNDTCLVVISFLPEYSGKFSKRIALISSDNSLPYELNISGNLTKLKTNDKTACYYFGNRKNTTSKTPVDITIEKEVTEPNKIPEMPLDTIKSAPLPVNSNSIGINSNELSLLEYKPNNILFLVDVSSSMKDSLKLPVMKVALHTLINAIRDIDVISLVTYADSVTVIKEGVNGSNKKQLHDIVNSLKAKGLTKGNKAILFSQQLAQKHFIAEGNNEIIMATDGKFRFYSEDYTTWTQKQLNKKIVLTTIGFGNDRDAVKNLKEIANKGGGSFIHIKKRHGSETKLLEEIKTRSKR